ncbi:hypothetical protein OS493_013298, partial [Desmophyllum pertusum]
VCSNNWVDMQGSCYKFFSTALNWNASKSACKKLGSKLVVINSQAEQQALGSKIPDAQLTWIGLYRDPNNESRWLWVDGTRPTYTHWDTGEPNNVQEECTHMNPKVQGWKWNDLRCTGSLPYICETPSGKSENISCCSMSFLKFYNFDRKSFFQPVCTLYKTGGPCMQSFI